MNHVLPKAERKNKQDAIPRSDQLRNWPNSLYKCGQKQIHGEELNKYMILPFSTLPAFGTFQLFVY